MCEPGVGERHHRQRPGGAQGAQLLLGSCRWLKMTSLSADSQCTKKKRVPTRVSPPTWTSVCVCVICFVSRRVAANDGHRQPTVTVFVSEGDAIVVVFFFIIILFSFVSSSSFFFCLCLCFGSSSRRSGTGVAFKGEWCCRQTR